MTTLASPLGPLVADRSLAATAGETTYSFREEVEQLLAANGGKRGRAVNAGIDELVSRGVLTTTDADDVRKVAQAVYAVERGRTDASAAAVEVGRIYQRLQGDAKANPVALTVASVAHTGLTRPGSTVPPGVSAATSGPEVTVIPYGVVAGAVTGALFGAAMGGLLTENPVGALVGAVIGAVVGGAIGACNDPDKRGGDPPAEG